MGFVAGGNSDLIARALSIRMSQAMGQQVIVDNRPGANGGIARGMVAQSARDGYTITIIGPSTLVFGEVTHRTDYDPMREFAPLARVGEYQNILITHPAVPVHTLADYIALAKAQPGKINYATSGVGGAGHMAMELLRSMTHIHVTHVPYKGGGSAINDLIAGQVESFMAIVSTSIPHIQSGKARALAVTGSRRAVALPDVPTVAQAGFPGYEATTWAGVVAAGGTVRPLVERLYNEIAAAMRDATMKPFLEARGIDPFIANPDEFGAYMKSERAKWMKVVKDAGIVQ
ncbi:MAG TPA: tripartite tricarboxylate transporter substrate-binding protein [Burkholderiales bacterium]|nr:tripartite tricarboxylate transporter substrate-binding protein [Burkholderiales bacterium]